MLSYIDPGTGSMLFTLIIGLATAAFFAVRGLFIKITYLFHRGKKADSLTLEQNSYPYVIFSDSKRYWNVFKPICDEFEKRGLALQYFTMSEDDPALSAPYKSVHALYIGEGASAFAKLNTMKAGVCLSTTPGLDVYQWKRSKNVKHYVHITHDVCAITAYRMFGIDFFDEILLPNHHLIPELRELESRRKLPEKKVEVVGSTYMDGLMAQKEAKDKESSSEKNPKENITVLVAPSWGESSILNRYGEKLLKELQATDFNVIVRPHPQSFISDAVLMENLQKKFPEGEKMHWNRDNDNFKVLSNSDVLITDFSGVIFDYAFTFGRPVLCADTKLDLSPYDDFWLSEKPWRLKIIEQLTKPLKEEEFNQLKNLIPSLLKNNQYLQNIEKIKNSAWEFKGKAAERTVDYLLNLNV